MLLSRVLRDYEPAEPVLDGLLTKIFAFHDISVAPFERYSCGSSGSCLGGCST